jgi:hypothetical protein
MNIRIKISALAVLVFGVTACDALLTDPAPASPDIDMSFAIEGATSDGVVAAFDRVNRVYLRFTRPDSVQRDTIIRFTHTDGVAKVRLVLDTKERVAALGIFAELRVNTTPLFQGARVIRVENGTATSAEITLAPVPAHLRADRNALVFENVGDTVRLASAVLFASGDTIPDAAGSWVSEDATIVQVTPAGLAIARHVGETRLLVRFGSLTDTVPARVLKER